MQLLQAGELQAALKSNSSKFTWKVFDFNLVTREALRDNNKTGDNVFTWS